MEEGAVTGYWPGVPDDGEARYRGYQERLGLSHELQQHRFLASPHMRRTLDEFSRGIGKSRRRAVIKDFAVLCIASFCGAVGSLPLNAHQTSANCQNSIGFFALAALYGSFALSVGPSKLLINIRQLSPRLLLLCGLACQVVFVAANNYTAFSTLLPAAIVSGIGHGIMWHVQMTLVSSLSLQYTAFSSSTPEKAPETTFQSIFGLIYELGFILGNLYTSLLFYLASWPYPINEVPQNLTVVSWNDSEAVIGIGLAAPNETCSEWTPGSTPCVGYSDWATSFRTLLSSYSAFLVSSFLIILFGLNSPDIILQRSGSTPATPAITTVRNVWGSCNVPIAVLCCFTGLQQAFVFGDITQLLAVVSTIDLVGVGMCFYGLARTPWLLVSNSRWQGAISGHGKVWLLGAKGLILTVICYTLTAGFLAVQSTPAIYIIAVLSLWGFVDGLNDQLIAAISQKTPHKGVVGVTYPCLHSLGMAAGFVAAPFVCAQYRLYTLMSLVGLTCVVIGLLSLCHRIRQRCSQGPTGV